MKPFGFSNGFFLLLQALRRRHAHVLVQLSWTHESATMTARLAVQAARFRRRFPRHHVTFLANTPEETEAIPDILAG